MVDVVVVNYNDYENTSQFLRSCESYAFIETIVVVDNCSSDESYEKLSKLQSGKIIVVATDRNGGYGYGNNLGLRELARLGHDNNVLIANPDTFFDECVLYRLDAFLRDNPDYLIASPMMLNSERIPQKNSAIKVPGKINYILSLGLIYNMVIGPTRYKEEILRSNYMNVDAVSGALFLINVRLFSSIGMFDEGLFLYCEEVTIGIRARRQNMKIAILEDITFVHNHSQTINKTYASEVSKRRLLIKSKMYVLKKYYRIGPIGKLFALLVSRIGLLEVKLLSFRRK